MHNHKGRIIIRIREIRTKSEPPRDYTRGKKFGETILQLHAFNM